MRPPVVSNIDRNWAMAQMPSWCQRGSLSDGCGEIIDDGGWLDADDLHETLADAPNWSAFVAEEIEKFERHYAGKLNDPAEWSSIWRKGWWPRVSPRKRFPKSAPKDPQPFFRFGTPEFERALKVATKEERQMWKRFGVAQLKPNDRRLDGIVTSPTGETAA